MDSITPKRPAFQPEPYRDIIFVELGLGTTKFVLAAGVLGAAAVYVWWRRLTGGEADGRRIPVSRKVYGA